MSKLRTAPQRSTTIADVAARAGVSTATVSRALTNPGQLRKQTLTRVKDAVAQTGYMPNVAARTLRGRRTMVVLIVLPDIANPFFADVLRGIEDGLSRHGYGLLIGEIGPNGEKQEQIVGIVQTGQVDGVMLLNGHVPAKGGLPMTAYGVPMVALCEAIPDARFPQIEVRNFEGARQAAEHLAGLGHRHIAYVGGPERNILERERQAGFRHGLAASGLAAKPACFFAGDFTLEAGVAAATRFLAMRRRPTALFAANDEMAIGFLKTVCDAGLRVPEDVSVMGFDGIAFADFVQPTLTTFRQPRRELGLVAAGLLMRAIAGEPLDGPEFHVRLDAVLLDRASTGQAPGVAADLGIS